MTRDEFSTYLVFIALAMGVLGVVNLLRPTKRWLGASSLCWGLSAMLYREGLAIFFVAVPAALAVLCLGLQAKSRERRSA